MPVLMTSFPLKRNNCQIHLAIARKHIDDSIFKSTYIIRLKHSKYIIRGGNITYITVLVTSLPFMGDTCYINLAAALMASDFLHGLTILCSNINFYKPDDLSMAWERGRRRRKISVDAHAYLVVHSECNAPKRVSTLLFSLVGTSF